MSELLIVDFEGRPSVSIPAGLRAVLAEKLEAADVRESGRAMLQLLEFFMLGLRLNYRQSAKLCHQLRPSVDAERFEELCLLADLVESSEGGA